MELISKLLEGEAGGLMNTRPFTPQLVDGWLMGRAARPIDSRNSSELLTASSCSTDRVARPEEASAPPTCGGDMARCGADMREIRRDMGETWARYGDIWGRHGGDMARYAGDMTSTMMCDGAMSRPASVCTSAGHLRRRNGCPWSLRRGEDLRLHLGWPRCGEEQVLPVVPHVAEDRRDLRLEAEVEHPIRLVER